MSRLIEFHDIIEKSRINCQESIFNGESSFIRETHNEKSESNRMYLGDNLDAMVHLLQNGYKERLDLVYIDPPFFSGADYRKRIRIETDGEDLVFYNHTFGDTWKGGLMEYLEMIATRLFLIKELLSDRGTIYVHVDNRTAHYMRLILDEVFGEERFLNEIIWSYKSGGAGRKSFSKKHDNILVYTKTKGYIFNPIREKSYNRGMKPYRFKNVSEYQDELGWYTLVNMKDVWTVNMVGRTSAERVGYQTQKPEALLAKIVESSSNPGSVVGDFFMGSGTTLKVAENMGRRWVGSDSSIQSILTAGKRLGAEAGFHLYHNLGDNDSSLEFSVEMTEKNNRKRISIKDIAIDEEIIEKNSSDPQLAERLIHENPSSYIDYLGVYRVNIYRECIREFYGPEVEMEFNLDDVISGEDRLTVRLIDIFGNTAEKELEG
ncbi:MAG: DNA-methyltransferase [Bacillota bacterium]